MVHRNDLPSIVTNKTTIDAQTYHGVIPTLPSHNFTKYFPDVSKVDVFGGQNITR